MWEMPYHAEHHRYPALPFFALAPAHASLGPHLAHVARRGYLGVHRDFLERLSDHQRSRWRRHQVTSLSQIAEQKGIRYFLVSFTDLRGVQRAKLVPAASIDRIAADGAGFAGFATWLDMTPADADMLAIADPRSLIQLPWKPEVAWVAGDLVMNGKPVEQAPRRVLQRQIQRATERGFAVRTGVECEFFVLSPDGASVGRRRRPPEQTLLRPAGADAAL